jgi:hypothetical protein
MKSIGKYFIIRGWPHQLVLTPTVGISGYNNVKSGGPTFVSERNLDRFQSWNRTESLVWSGRETWVIKSPNELTPI